MEHFITRSTLDNVKASLTNSTCPSPNLPGVDPSSFWSANHLNWDAHREGWVAAGAAALVTTIVGGINIWRHCRNYRNPLQQRQIVRILLMPIIFAIVSFFGYRFFREFIYFELVRDTYESVTIAAFLCLMLLFLSNTPDGQREVLSKKDKRSLVFPFCCFRYRASKPYFIHTVKWSVLQFSIIKPLLAIASIITEAFGVLCSTSQSFAFANVYIEIIDFVCISIALYGLIILYTLTHEELAEHRPLSKFMTIKIIVALVFYQGFVFTLLAHFKVIKATEYWSVQNISDGLNALATCVEMVLISLFQLYAFPASEYKPEMPDDTPQTSFWRSFLHSQNYSDFVIDIYYALKFFLDALLQKPYTKATPTAATSGGNSYDLWKAFDYHDQAFIPPPGMDAKTLDPQRPYITPLSWSSQRDEVDEESHLYPPVYGRSGMRGEKEGADGDLGEVEKTQLLDKEYWEEGMGKGQSHYYEGGGEYKKLENED